MSEQIDELVENLKRPSLWKRVFFTLGFALLFNIILVPLVLLMVLVQVAFSLFAGEIMEGFSLTDGQWGSVYALSTTCSAIVMVWVGALTDKYRARTLGVIFLCILAFTCFLMSLVTSFWVLPILIFFLRFLDRCCDLFMLTI